MKRFLYSSACFAVILASFWIGWPQKVEASLSTSDGSAYRSFRARPRLVVVVSIDQFRADFLTRHHSRFLPKRDAKGEGGFRFLMEEGAYFPYSEQVLAQAMTGPGHASILSGTLPYHTGIPSNYWYDSKSGKKMYCTSDESVRIVGSSAAKKDGGMSPRNFNGTTLGDELNLSGEKSKVVSIALKDRASILMGGRRPDLAIWFEPKAYRWVTSSYYWDKDQLPDWLSQLNSRVDAKKGKKVSWTIEGSGSGVSTTQSFPHLTEIGSYESLSGPVGIDLSVEAAEAALSGFELGKDDSPDILAVSLSTHDYIGHQYGPNSRESEEITAYEDQALSRLIQSIKRQVPGGLNEVVFVLTADHGAPSHPDWVNQIGIPSGKFKDEELVGELEKALQKKWGTPSDSKGWIAFHYDLGFTFSPEALRKSKVSKRQLEETARTFLEQQPGVHRVLTASDAQAGLRVLGGWSERWISTYYPGRSPDVVIIPQPGFMSEGDGVSHQTSWAYDRLVPIVFFGKGIKKGVYPEPARVIDIAPTLAWLLGVLPPAMSEGQLLKSALK